jgi:predicted metalloprotease with PDZ domain
VRFSDSKVKWRDGDGPNETMTYHGGALLAFFTDIQLRHRGATVTDLIRQLLSRPQRTYGLNDIRNAMTRLGVSDVYRQSIAGTHVPAVRPLLIAAGFDEDKVSEPASLTYLGIEARPESTDPMAVVPAVVVAIDPAGPAAKVGLQVGDRIVDIGDRRGDPPMIGPTEVTRYRFGLNVIPSGARTVTLRVATKGSVREVQVVPVRRSGGVRYPLRWNPERGARFLTIN